MSSPESSQANAAPDPAPAPDLAPAPVSRWPYFFAGLALSLVPLGGYLVSRDLSTAAAPELYRATAVLAAEPWPIPTDEDSERESHQQFGRANVELLQDSYVFDAVLADPEIAQFPDLANSLDPTDLIAERLQADFMEDTGLIHVALDWSDPDEAAQLLNAIVGNYLSVRLERERSSNARRIEWVEQSCNRRRLAVDALAAKLADERATLAGDAPRSQEETDVRRDLLRDKYKAVRLQLEGTTTVLADRMARLKETATPEDEIDAESHRPYDSPEMAALRTKQQTLAKQVRSLADELEALRVPREIEQLEAKLRTEAGVLAELEWRMNVLRSGVLQRTTVRVLRSAVPPPHPLRAK